MKRLGWALLLCGGLAQAQVDQIHGDGIRAHVKYLASDLLEGRGVGQRGGQLAENYIAAAFQSAGLKPGAADGTYLQKVPFKLVTTTPDPTLTFTHGGKTESLKWLEEFVGSSQMQTPAVDVDADAVFVGHGIVAPEFGWNDYAGMDVKGKVVVLFTNEPPSTDPKFFGARALTYYGRWTYKYEEALRQGAAAVLIVHTDETAGYPYGVVKANGRPQPQVARASGAPALAFAGWISQAWGDKLFGAAGSNVAEMLKKANTKGFRGMPLGVKVKLHLAETVTDIDTHNVVAKVEGSDPQLAREAVVFTAHMDHLGVGTPVNGDSIYNGAVDNASGCGLLLEMAKAWAMMNPKPKRSAYFVAVTAEESGLLGSKYFAEHPPLPAEQIAANLNFDSFSPFGRMKDVVLNGAERVSFFSTVKSVAQRYGLAIQPDPAPEQGVYFRSDHFSFVKVGVPAFSVEMGETREAPLSLKLKALEEKLKGTYHQPGDEYTEDWDFSGMEQFARFGFTLGLEVANLDKIPTRVKP